jgi:hypothetical protein
MEAHADPMTAFKDTDYALLVGSRPRGPGMERAELLAINGAIFTAQGKALNAVASRNVKVLVVGNPANTNAYIAMKSAPDLKARQLHRHAATGPQPCLEPNRCQNRQSPWRASTSCVCGATIRPPCTPITASPPLTEPLSKT